MMIMYKKFPHSNSKQEPKEMTRRQFGTASGGIFLAPSFISFPSQKPRKLDVNIYVGAEIYDNNSLSVIQTMLDLYKKNIIHVFETLTDGTNIDLSITTPRKRIPSHVGGKNEDWKQYVENDLRSPADDSNILLTGHDNPDFYGRAYSPCRICDPSQSSAGSVFGVSPSDYQFFAAFDDQIVDTVTTHTSYRGITTAIYEIGHNVGLHHHHSETIEKDGRKCETLMGVDYHKNGGPFYRTNQFAEHLTADDLRLSEDGGVDDSLYRRLSNILGL